MGKGGGGVELDLRKVGFLGGRVGLDGRGLCVFYFILWCLVWVVVGRECLAGRWLFE